MHIEHFGQDPDAAIVAAVKHAALAGPFDLVFGAKEYVFAHAWEITAAINIVGAGRDATQLRWTTEGNAGIRVRPGAGRVTGRGFSFTGPTPWSGADVGLLLERPLCSFDDVRAVNWSGQGFRIEGHLGDQPPTNANLSTITNAEALTCGHGGAQAGQPNEMGAGVLCIGSDANGGMLANISLRDCRVGGFDASFLGNTWLAGAEGCNNRFDQGVQTPTPCGFKTNNRNTRATFLGCYTEADSEAEVLYPSMIFGGLFGNRGDALMIGPLGAQGAMPAVSVYKDAAGQSLRMTATLGGGPAEGLSFLVGDAVSGAAVCRPQAFRYGQSVPGWWALNDIGIQDAFRWLASQLWVPGDLMLGQNGAPNGTRIAFGNPAWSKPRDGGEWRMSDRILADNPQPGQPSEWVCVAPGDAQTPPTWKVCGRVEP